MATSFRGLLPALKAVVRELRESDFAWIARLHLELLPGDLAPSLGESFLCEYLYPAFLKEGRSLVVPKEGALLLSENLSVSLIGALQNAWLRPKTWFRLVSTQFRRRHVDRPLSSYLEVSFIFCRPGLGKQMILEARSRNPRKGFYALTDSAAGFYEKLGFKKNGYERRGLRQMTIFSLDGQ